MYGCRVRILRWVERVRSIGPGGPLQKDGENGCSISSVAYARARRRLEHELEHARERPRLASCILPQNEPVCAPQTRDQVVSNAGTAENLLEEGCAGVKAHFCFGT